MYLGPHHFQAQSRYFEDAIQFAASALWFAPFGFLDYELNAEALRNGTLLLSHARGFFEDGLPFDMPSCDPLPEPRALAGAFPPTAHSLTVFLSVPKRKDLGGNCTLAGDRVADGIRFKAEERAVPDEIVGGDEKTVSFACKNIRVSLEGEDLAAFQNLALARVLRDGAGQFIADDKFIPPLLRSAASPPLLSIIRRLIDVLTQKAAALTGSVGDYSRQQSGMSARQVSIFWFLHAVNSSLASLRHLYLSKQNHPEELYREMLRLAGALCTFGLESSAANLPIYDHSNLESCFFALDSHIREHLELLTPSNAVSVSLKPAERYFWEADLKDTRLFGPSRWFFSIAANIGEAELISGTPALVKICSARFVPELVKRALPGLQLTHVPSPPAALAPRISNQYFAINRTGPCWNHLLETRKIGIYVPGEIPNPELELVALLES
jgi:type VI secretion system protein ImpJ